MTPELKEILSKLSATNGTKKLLANSTVTTQVSGSIDSLELVLQQLQRDVVDLKDLDSEQGWAIIKAIGLVHDYALLFNKMGEDTLKRESASVQKPSTK